MSEPKDGAIFDFNVKQYEEHRKTLLAVVQEERQMERYVVLGFGGFYSWLATQQSAGDVFLGVAAFVPIVIVIFCLLRSHAIGNGVRTEAAYLRKLEERIYANAPEQYNGPRGWETFLATDGKYVKKYESSQNIFWYLLLVMTTCASFAFLWLKA